MNDTYSLSLTPQSRRRHEHPSVLIFSPLAWLKLQFFLHAGDTEIGGFGVSRPDDLLYVQDFVTVRQRVSSVTVEFDDAAVADHFDAMVDRGLEPRHFSRIWIHTHPGSSALPSGKDEETFERVFGRCDWSIMFILARSGQTYARLRFNAGLSAATLLSVHVDWASWPRASVEQAEHLGQLVEGWANEYFQNVQPEAELLLLLLGDDGMFGPHRHGRPIPTDTLDDEYWAQEWLELDAQEHMAGTSTPAETEAAR